MHSIWTLLMLAFTAIRKTNVYSFSHSINVFLVLTFTQIEAIGSNIVRNSAFSMFNDEPLRLPIRAPVYGAEQSHCLEDRNAA